jgi:hypothetical protein
VQSAKLTAIRSTHNRRDELVALVAPHNGETERMTDRSSLIIIAVLLGYAAILWCTGVMQ